MRKAFVQTLYQLRDVASAELESETIEFKDYPTFEQVKAQAKDIAKELSAFANLRGGLVIVGVRDQSAVNSGTGLDQLVGTEELDVDLLRERLGALLSPKCRLTIIQEVHFGRNVLAIGIDQSFESLVMTSSGATYIREGRSSRPLTSGELSSAVMQLQNRDWSSEPIRGHATSLLSKRQLQEAKLSFIEHKRLGPNHLNDEAFLEAVGATVDGVLTNAGLLFLGERKAIADRVGAIEYQFKSRSLDGNLILNDIWEGSI